MIASGIVERKPQKFCKGDSVVDLDFQLRIGNDLKPLLKKEAFHKDNRRISIVTLKAFICWIVSHEQAFDSEPVDSSVDLFHSFDSPVLFHGSK